jgi:polygalacturonase
MMSLSKRNDFFFFLFFVFVAQMSPVRCVAQNGQGWAALPKILENIHPPQFPSRDFDVTQFGALGDGTTDCTEAFQKAIANCSEAHGGRVVVPKGIFLTGAIHLKSNVDLYVTKDATIRFSTNPKKYLPAVYTRWEGVECMNYSALIYAYGQENIAITGEGVLDGQGSSKSWWSWSGKSQYGWKQTMPSQADSRDTLFAMGERGVPVSERLFGEGHYLRPNFLQVYKCKNVLVEGVTLKNSPMWFIHPVLSENVSVVNVTVEGLGPNNDGCDPESAKDVLIKNCSFNTGDDCIAIKSGRNADGRRVNVPSENIIVQGCAMKDGHGGVVIGSEMSGGVRNVYAERCTMDSPRLDRALRIKTNSVRGGVVENVFMRDADVRRVAEAVIKINFFYEEGDAGTFTPVVRNVQLKNVRSDKSAFAVWIKAYERSPATDICIEDCVFNKVAKPSVVENVKNLQYINVRLNGEIVSSDARQ